MSFAIAKLATRSSKKDSRQHLGAKYEQEALEYLRRNGLKLIKQNYRCRFGEIDLVMHDAQCLVFIEVRFRNHNRFSSASLTVDHHKQARLLKTAAMFLSQQQHFGNATVRFDVLAFDGGDDRQSEIQWIKDAFRP